MRPLALVFALLVGSAPVAALPGEAFADGVSPAVATAAQKRRAQAKFVEGSKLFEKSRFDEAQQAFEASYAIVESPNSHLMIARTMRAKGDLVGAFRELEKVVEEARRLSESGKPGSAKYAETVAMATGDLDELRRLLGLVRVRLEGGRHAEGASVRIGERELSPEEREGGAVVAPGPVEVVVETPSGRRRSKRIEAVAGESSEVALDLAPPPPPPLRRPPPPRPPPAAPPPRRASLAPVGVTAAGLGGLGLVVFVTSSLMADASEETAVSPCPEGLLPSRCEERRRREQGAADSLRTVGAVGLVAGIAGLATGGVLLVVEAARGEPEAKEKAAPRRAPTPHAALVVGPGSLRLEGSF